MNVNVSLWKGLLVDRLCLLRLVGQGEEEGLHLSTHSLIQLPFPSPSILLPFFLRIVSASSSFPPIMTWFLVLAVVLVHRFLAPSSSSPTADDEIDTSSSSALITDTRAHEPVTVPASVPVTVPASVPVSTPSVVSQSSTISHKLSYVEYPANTFCVMCCSREHLSSDHVVLL
jgi:hypothetical protein